ncbi:MAG: ribosomal-protein-alanine N-acetyltransferase [Chrysiogenales bacterium]|nr:MAG: ribosomal-protein-alanine N-acetyltransferase [Chrysiogenales bacterium]
MPKVIWPELTAPLIRKAAAADLPAILQIECEQFSNPWRLEYFLAELDNSFSNLFVFENSANGALIGYLLFWRLGVELELHKIAVAKAWQGQGYALQLMEFLIRTARSWGSERVILEVRAHNTPAINLYEKFAFRGVGRRRDYYDRPVEDALLYELVL